MSKPTPKVSVIIPTYNRADMIVESLESVLNQSYKDFEVIVVDDGSTDNTQAALQNYLDRIVYIRQDRQGQSSATNRGIKLARGEYVAFLDSDDVWLPDKLEKQVKFLDAHPDYAMLTGNGVYVHNERTLLVPQKRAEPLEKNDISLRDIYMKSSIMTSTMIMRRTVLDTVSGLDPELKSSIHLDFAFRVLIKHKVAFLNDVLIKLRRHSGERISTNEERRQIYNLKVIRKLIENHPEAVDIIGEKNVRERIAYRYYRLAKIYYARKDYAKALEDIRMAHQYWPSAKYLLYRFRFDLEFSADSALNSSRDFLEMRRDGFKFHMRRDCIQPSFLQWLREEIRTSGTDWDRTSRHARNRRADVPLGGRRQRLFVKRFFSPRLSYSIKDIFRPSKAINAWKVSLMLTEFGFSSAPIVLAGERRKLGLLADSMLVTNEVRAPTIIEYLSGRFQKPTEESVPQLTAKRTVPEASSPDAVRRKRKLIRQLGMEVGRMHLLGIVHGDLLPGNILVDESQGDAKFVFLDNDRTRRLLRAIPVKLVVRNLVQLGRFPLPGITLTDRLRFFKAYVEENPRFKGWEKELITRIVKTTRERMIKIERMTSETAETLSFRALMSGKRLG